MTQGITSSRSTDDLLRQAMLDSGDHDPETIAKEGGKPLHFDALDSANIHRAGLRSDGAAAGEAKNAAIDQARDQAIERAAHLAAHVLGPAVAGLGTITGAVVSLGSLYKSAIEDAKHEGEAQRALSASDAGVVALAQTLDVEPAFRAFVSQAHAGSSNVAAAMAARLADPKHAGMRAELQRRADRGLVDAAGYAHNAAVATRPFLDQARAKTTAASQATDPAMVAKLRAEAGDLMAKAAATARRFTAPVLSRAEGDAAYGLGVQRAVFLAAQGGGALDVAASTAAARSPVVVNPSPLPVKG